MTESEPTSHHLTLDLSFLEHTIHLTHLHLPFLLLLSHFKSAQSKHASHALRWLGLVRQRPRIVVFHIPRLYICCAPKSPSLTCICNRFRPPTPVQPFSLTTRDNGSSRPMRTLLQNDQIRHNPYSLELQHVPLRAPLVHLRMPTLQVEDVQAVHVQGLSGGWLTRGTHKPLNPKALFSYASFPRGAAAFQTAPPETRNPKKFN